MIFFSALDKPRSSEAESGVGEFANWAPPHPETVIAIKVAKQARMPLLRRALAAQSNSCANNVMKYYFYDILAEAIAAQRVSALMLLLAFGKCHDTYGCVTFLIA